jgi:hypothetical protein
MNHFRILKNQFDDGVTNDAGLDCGRSVGQQRPARLASSNRLETCEYLHYVKRQLIAFNDLMGANFRRVIFDKI